MVVGVSCFGVVEGSKVVEVVLGFAGGGLEDGEGSPPRDVVALVEVFESTTDGSIDEGGF